MDNHYFLEESSVDQYYINSDGNIDKFIKYLSMCNAKFDRIENEVTVIIREKWTSVIIQGKETGPGVYTGEKAYRF